MFQKIINSLGAIFLCGFGGSIIYMFTSNAMWAWGGWALTIFILWSTWRNKDRAPVVEHLGGASMSDVAALATHTHDGTESQLTFGGIPLPRDYEPLGVAVIGAPGGGKTQAINFNLQTIRDRDERVMMLDAGGEAMTGWYREGDIVLNPFDGRCASWSPFAEIEEVWDCKAVAFAMVGPDDSAEKFKDYATQLIAAVLEKLIEQGTTTNRKLLYWLTVAKRKDLAKLVAGMPVARLFDDGADRHPDQPGWRRAALRQACAGFAGDDRRRHSGGGSCGFPDGLDGDAGDRRPARNADVPDARSRERMEGGRRLIVRGG